MPKPYVPSPFPMQRKRQGYSGRRGVFLDALLKRDVQFGLPGPAGTYVGLDVMHRYAPGRETGWMGGPATQCWYCYGWADDWRHV